jgi:hypothetical protein
MVRLVGAVNSSPTVENDTDSTDALRRNAASASTHRDSCRVIGLSALIR